LTGAGVETINKFMVPLLGSWHPLKMICTELWRRGAYFFFAPLQHCLSPQGNFRFEGNKLSSLTYLYSLIRLSFPSWRPELVALLNDEKFKRDSGVFYHHAKNLFDTASYFIPVVRHMHTLETWAQNNLGCNVC
jgi:hypothetical protein